MYNKSLLPDNFSTAAPKLPQSSALNYYRKNMETQTSLKQRIENLFKSDPKPIFDHFRNIGIAAALALGAGALRSFSLENNPWHLNDIALVCSYVTFAIS